MKKYISSAENSLNGEDFEQIYNDIYSLQLELWEKALEARKTDRELSKKLLDIWNTLDNASDAVLELF